MDVAQHEHDLEAIVKNTPSADKGMFVYFPKFVILEPSGCFCDRHADSERELPTVAEMDSSYLHWSARQLPFLWR
jgi:hypothetical protein